MHRQARNLRPAQQRRRSNPHESGPLAQQQLRRACIGGRVRHGPGGQCRHQPFHRTHSLRKERQLHADFPGEWVLLAIPEQSGSGFQRQAPGKIGCPVPPVPGSILANVGEPGFQHRIPGQGPCPALRLGLVALHQQLADVAGIIAFLLARPRHGADQAPADIGIEGGRLDAEFGDGLAGGEIKRLAHILIVSINIDHIKHSSFHAVQTAKEGVFP